MKTGIESIRKEFRRSSETRYIHRLHGVLLVLSGLSTVKTGELLGVPQRTVSHWAIQFETHGLDGLRDPKRSGRPHALTEDQQKALFDALHNSPDEAGLSGERWTNALISSLLKKRFGVTLSNRQCTRLFNAFKGTQTKN